MQKKSVWSVAGLGFILRKSPKDDENKTMLEINICFPTNFNHFGRIPPNLHPSNTTAVTNGINPPASFPAAAINMTPARCARSMATFFGGILFPQKTSASPGWMPQNSGPPWLFWGTYFHTKCNESAEFEDLTKNQPTFETLKSFNQ